MTARGVLNQIHRGRRRNVTLPPWAAASLRADAATARPDRLFPLVSGPGSATGRSAGRACGPGQRPDTCAGTLAQQNAGSGAARTVIPVDRDWCQIGGSGVQRAPTSQHGVQQRCGRSGSTRFTVHPAAAQRRYPKAGAPRLNKSRTGSGGRRRTRSPGPANGPRPPTTSPAGPRCPAAGTSRPPKNPSYSPTSCESSSARSGNTLLPRSGPGCADDRTRAVAGYFAARKIPLGLSRRRDRWPAAGSQNI